MKLLESEEKYLIDIKADINNWEKEFIVYQWYEESNYDTNQKLKVMFDIIHLTYKCVRVKKKRVNNNIFEKKVDYLNFKDIDLNSLIGMDFVMKRRSIKDNIFLDKFIRSNNTCEHLLEIEYENNINYSLPKEIELLKNVTNDFKYYNQNICTKFIESDYVYLKLLIEWMSINNKFKL